MVCSLQVAAVVSSTFYSIWNLFSGFLIPQVSSLRGYCLDEAYAVLAVSSIDLRRQISVTLSNRG